MTWLFLLSLLLLPQGGQQAPKPRLETQPQPAEKHRILPPGDPQVVSVLSFDGKEFIEAFNATADRPRIVMVLSPTCPSCIGVASEVRSVLQDLPEAKVKAFVLWTPLMGSDNKARAVIASAYLPESRAEHYWDLWNFVCKVYTEQLKFPPEEVAWDMLVFYKPHLTWRSAPPEPTMWMQHRGLKIGLPLDKEVLKAELKKWIQ